MFTVLFIAVLSFTILVLIFLFHTALENSHVKLDKQT